jgi:G3E family GTPase
MQHKHTREQAAARAHTHTHTHTQNGRLRLESFVSLSTGPATGQEFNDVLFHGGSQREPEAHTSRVPDTRLIGPQTKVLIDKELLQTLSQTLPRDVE